MADLERRGLYKRPYCRYADGRLYDAVSNHTMSTEFAITRFFLPHLAKGQPGERGWAMFADADVMARKDLSVLFTNPDPKYAVYCVKHQHVPTAGEKMDGQQQSLYFRKNWSSMVLWNLDHPAHDALTLEVLNSVRGLWLHQFQWLKDEEIGGLDEAFNWLAGYSDPAIDPALVHFTNGLPCMAGYESSPYADEWRQNYEQWAENG